MHFLIGAQWQRNRIMLAHDLLHPVPSAEEFVHKANTFSQAHDVQGVGAEVLVDARLFERV